MRNGRVLLSSREANSVVWRVGDFVIKEAPKTQIETEFYFLSALAESGYVPAPVYRIDIEAIKMPFIENEPVTNRAWFLSHIELVLSALRRADCRHGDLTEYSVLVNNNKPIIIDFAESRCMSSPIPDKRQEGDKQWLYITMNRLANKNG